MKIDDMNMGDAREYIGSQLRSKKGKEVFDLLMNGVYIDANTQMMKILRQAEIIKNKAMIWSLIFGVIVGVCVGFLL